MNPAITILQAFNEPLPLVEDDFKESYRKISTSVQSTMDTDPPSVFLQFEASELAVLSKEVLGRQFHPRSRVYADMPILEKNHVLKSEGDVVRIVTMQLLSIPVVCRCEEYAVCGCDRNTNRSYFESLFNGTQPANSNVIKVAKLNGTETISINGTVADPSTQSKATATTAQSMGYWLAAILVVSGVWCL
ncbi:unnamed protein product [Aspergillus oryzae]|nr:unnamed protein product [Aspergillus oryzae]